MTKPEEPSDSDAEQPKPAPVQVQVTGWRNWGDHPIVIGFTVLASVFGIAQFFKPPAEASPGGPVQEQGCSQVVGRWDWLSTGGVVAFAEDGLMHWYRVSTDPLPTINGTWVCQDRTPLHLTLKWVETGLVDTLVLSADGQRLAGENMANKFKLSATRAR